MKFKNKTMKLQGKQFYVCNDSVMSGYYPPLTKGGEGGFFNSFYKISPTPLFQRGELSNPPITEWLLMYY
jgi:hypothetical protein